MNYNYLLFGVDGTEEAETTAGRKSSL